MIGFGKIQISDTLPDPMHPESSTAEVAGESLAEIRSTPRTVGDVFYMFHPSFDDADAVRARCADALWTTLEPWIDEAERCPASPVPFLRGEEEQLLYWRMNFERHRAAMESKDHPGCFSARSLRDYLVRSNIPLVNHVLKTYFYECCYREASTRDEYFSDGTCLLLYCVDRFDFSRNIRFGAYFGRAMWQHIRRPSASFPSFSSLRYRDKRIGMFFKDISSTLDYRTNETELREVLEEQRHRAAVLLGSIENDDDFYVAQEHLMVDPAQTLEQIGNSLGVTKARAGQRMQRALGTMRDAAVQNEWDTIPEVSAAGREPFLPAVSRRRDRTRKNRNTAPDAG